MRKNEGGGDCGYKRDVLGEYYSALIEKQHYTSLHWRLVKKSIGHRWIPLTKSQECEKRPHAIMSPWCRHEHIHVESDNHETFISPYGNRVPMCFSMATAFHNRK